LSVTRATQVGDVTGTRAAAHAVTMQLWHLGLVSSLALGTVGSILVPTEVARIKRINGPNASLLGAKRVADRLFTWGFMIGSLLALVQLAALPLVNVFSSSLEVRAAARLRRSLWTSPRRACSCRACTSTRARSARTTAAFGTRASLSRGRRGPPRSTRASPRRGWGSATSWCTFPCTRR
jgi:hypothetical protein